MDPFGNDEIARLLRLKRYEQPPPAYFENFLSEFCRRQRDELLRQPSWRICFERAQEFALHYNVRSLASYAAGIAAVLACAVVISITIYQQPKDFGSVLAQIRALVGTRGRSVAVIWLPHVQVNK